MTLGKVPLRGLLIYACTITFSSQMVVLNQLMSHTFVLHRSFTGLSVDFDNDRLVGGRDNREIV